MRSLGGFVLLAGIGVGLFVYFPAPVDRSTTLEQATRAIEIRAAEKAPAPVPATAQSAISRIASFAPGLMLAAPQAQRRPPVADATPAAPAPTPAAKVETIVNWETSVSPAAGSGALEPTDPDSRYKLVVDIQQQLKRVGCYWGRAHGSWNASTRDAMREFTMHSNSALPVEKPDYLLLSLLKSYDGRSCGAAQPTVAAAPAAAPETLPWKAKANPQQTATRLFTPVPTSVVTTEPLPGRMAIGGPRELTPTTQEPLIPGGASQPQRGTSTAALEPPAAGGGAAAPAAAPKPRASKKYSSGGGSSRRPTPGTPRYNLMLSLGGVY